MAEVMSRISENPFLLKDWSARKRRPAVPPRFGSSCPPSGRDPRPVSICMDHDFTSSVGSPDLEYGPGIVQRLREKFSRLAKQSAQTAVVTSKRFPSVDDLLDSASTPPTADDLTSQTLPRMRTSKSALEPLASSSTSTGYSSEESSGQSDSRVFSPFASRTTKSVGTSTLPAPFPTTSVEVRTSAEINDSTEVEAETNYEAERLPIRSLREKFERHPKSEYNVRTVYSPRSVSAHTSVVARYDQPPARPSDQPGRPERVVLRPTGPELQQRQPQVSTPPTLQSKGVYSPPSSSTASSDRPPSDEPHQETSDDMESLQSQEDEYATVIKDEQTRGHFYRPESTYQPAEFKSTATDGESRSRKNETTKKRVEFTLPLDRPVLRNNGREVPLGRPGHTPTAEKTTKLKDESGMTEVHRLLGKFNAKRLADELPEAVGGEQTRKHEYSAALPPTPKLTPGKPRIPCPITNGGSDGQPISLISASPSTTASQSAQPTPTRRSLSAQYLESKKATSAVVQGTRSVQVPESSAEPNVVSENTTLSVDAVELDHDENTSISSLDSLDVVEEIADYEQEVQLQDCVLLLIPMRSIDSYIRQNANARTAMYFTMFATDHGPVRQSLLNFALQEDIPDLLQAMAEDLHFAFDDYSSGRQPMNGIMQKRRAQGQKRGRNNRICFDTKSPKVFTYLNESSALTEGQWLSGQHIPYEDYLKLCQDTQDQAARQAFELSKWRALMQIKNTEPDDAVNTTSSQLSQTSLQPPQPSPSTSRTPTPEDFGSSPTTSARFLYGTPTQRPIPAMRQEVGTSAI